MRAFLNQGMIAVMAFKSAMALATSDMNPEGQRIYRSAHFLGRGDTGIGDADNQEAIFYNPAGLAQGKGVYKRIVLGSPHIEISSQTRDIYQRLYVEEDDQTEVLKDQVGEPLHVGITSMSALVFRRAALGATVSSAANMLVRKDPNYGGLETVEADLFTNQILSFSLAESFFNDRILLGGTGKYIKRGQAGIEANVIDATNIKDISGDELMHKGTGKGLDLGLMIKGEKSPRMTEQSFGMTLTDIGDTSFKADADSNESPDELKQALNLGYVLSVGTKTSRMKFLVDYLDTLGAYETNTLKRLHLGTEINVKEFVGLSAGLNQGYPTAGLYFDTRIVRLDLGFYTEERSDRVGMYPDQRYYLRILVGL